MDTYLSSWDDFDFSLKGNNFELGAVGEGCFPEHRSVLRSSMIASAEAADRVSKAWQDTNGGDPFPPLNQHQKHPLIGTQEVWVELMTIKRFSHVFIFCVQLNDTSLARSKQLPALWRLKFVYFLLCGEGPEEIAVFAHQTSAVAISQSSTP
jgi:hypothetical protein